MVIDTVNDLVQKSYVDKKKILADVIRILHYDGKRLPQDIRQRWEQLKDTLMSNDFSSLMKRYVGMDLLEDSFDEQGNHVDQTQPRGEELAQQSIKTPQLLQSELDWLVTTEAQNGYRFGYELGRRDVAFSFLPSILSAQKQASKNPSVFFLGGYLRVLFEKDPLQWEKLADLLSEDATLNVWLPELTFRAGLSDHGALRLFKLAEAEVIDLGYFRYFSAGRSVQILSEDIFQKWVQLLLKSTHPYALSIALDLYYVYYVDRESTHTLPEQLTVKLLTHQLWLESEKGAKLDPMDYYHWTELGKVFAQSYSESTIPLANWMLEHFGEDNTILERFSETLSVLNVIAEQRPQDVWNLITRYLKSPVDTRAWHIKKWLRGEDDSLGRGVGGGLLLFPLEEIWRWVDEDVEQCAWYLASFVPKALFRQEGYVCLAREVLARYGEREDVRQAFTGNYFSASWWGPESSHYEEVKRKLLEFKEEEENENVILWIDEYVAMLDNYIQEAKLREERDAF